MKPRSGMTLVELLVVLTVGSTLLTLAAGMVHQSMLISEATKGNCEQMLATNRFLEQFRHDVHSATEVNCTSRDSMTILNRDDVQIIYVTDKNRIQRKQSLPNGRDRYEDLALDERANGVFEVRDQPQTAILTIHTTIGWQTADSRIDRCIEAVIGRARIELASREVAP